MYDLILKNATLPDGRTNMAVGVTDGVIRTVAQGIEQAAGKVIDVIDAKGYLLSPSFVDPHFHMDAAMSLGQPRLNRSGTLLEGIALWNELKPKLTFAAMVERALAVCRQALVQGVLHIRTHVDVCDPRLEAVRALLEVRRRMAPYLDIQLVAFPQDGYLRCPEARVNLERALDMGVDVVGGIPHFERTMDEGAASIRALGEIAAQRGLALDVHCDESDDPMSRHVETLAAETCRLGLQGRVTGSHLTSMHSMDNYYVTKLLPLMAEAQLHVIANPLINLTLQGRQDTYPKRRGLTRVPELLAAGINVAYGHDCVMDPWYSLGSHDMLDVAHMGLHATQMTSMEQMEESFSMVTTRGARVMGLQGYGLEVGCNADMVLLQARSTIDALRLRPPRLYVIRRGRVIASTPEHRPVLQLEEGTSELDMTSTAYLQQ
ncbi:MAG: amidohydrolase family protein [Desulfuromonas sp.]|jgi:cytosine deaminase|nr:amidohydrolase family protein [Desulfuromonas sp.]